MAEPKPGVVEKGNPIDFHNRINGILGYYIEETEYNSRHERKDLNDLSLKHFVEKLDALLSSYKGSDLNENTANTIIESGFSDLVFKHLDKFSNLNLEKINEKVHFHDQENPQEKVVALIDNIRNEDRKEGDNYYPDSFTKSDKQNQFRHELATLLKKLNEYKLPNSIYEEIAKIMIEKGESQMALKYLDQKKLTKETASILTGKGMAY